MKYCELFYTNLNIEPDRIQPCCDILRIVPPHVSYSGGKFPLDQYRKALSIASEANQNNEGPCNKCPLLQDKEQPSQSMQIRNVAINHQRSICNAKCVYCDFWKHPSPSYNIYPTIVDLLESNILHENAYFHWGGGEPTILPEFKDTSEYIFLKNKKQSVNTNAIVFSEQIANLLKVGACTICISLDCGTLDVYKIVHGVDKFHTVVNNIKNYVACSNNASNVGLKYILFKDNDREDEVANFLQLCQDIKCSNVMFSLNFDEVSTKTVSQSTLQMATRVKKMAASYNINAQFFFEGYYKNIIEEYQESGKEHDSFIFFSAVKTFLKRLSNNSSYRR